MKLLRAIVSSTRARAAKLQWTQRAAKLQWTHIVVIAFFLMLLLVAFAISVLGYVRRLEWTGVPDRTFWHWLELLVAPVLLSGGGFLLYALWAWSPHRNAQKEKFETARQADLHHITKGYLDEIEGLLDRFKADSEEEEKWRALARARTLNVLQGLDPYRKGSIIRSLYAASFIKPKSSEQVPSQQPYIRLKGANLREAHLRWVDLKNACLSGAKLSKADLSEADLSEADLSGADLSGADLRAANLTDALVTDDQLAKAKLARGKRHNIEGATMPNGQKYEDWLGTPQGQDWIRKHKKNLGADKKREGVYEDWIRTPEGKMWLKAVREDGETSALRNGS